MDLNDSIFQSVNNNQFSKIKKKINNNNFNSFFMHSLFDPYVYNGDGNDHYNVAKIFLKYLKQYICIYKKYYLQKALYFYDNLLEQYKIQSMKEIKDEFFYYIFNIQKYGNYAEINDDILLLSGFLKYILFL